jgi:hypothetical protein
MECKPLIIDGIKYYSVKHIYNLKEVAKYTWDEIGQAYGVSHTAVCRWYHAHKNTPEELLDEEGDYKAATRGRTQVRFINNIKNITSALELPSTDKMEDSYYLLRSFVQRQDYVNPKANEAIRIFRALIQKIYDIEVANIVDDYGFVLCEFCEDQINYSALERHQELYH